MPTKFIRQFDTAPSITATLQDAEGAAVDLDGAEIRFLLVDAFTRLPVLAEEANNDDQGDEETLGHVSYDWQVGDTDVIGVYRGEFEVTYQDTSIESFPNAEKITVIITAKAEEIAS
jgi:hypothetical protein